MQKILIKDKRTNLWSNYFAVWAKVHSARLKIQLLTKSGLLLVSTVLATGVSQHVD
jgi:hypothetical protein